MCVYCYIFISIFFSSPCFVSFIWRTGSVHPMVTVTPSPLAAGPILQPPPTRRSAESSPSHSHSHSHSQMSRNSSRKSNNSVNCRIDGKCNFSFSLLVFFSYCSFVFFFFGMKTLQLFLANTTKNMFLIDSIIAHIFQFLFNRCVISFENCIQLKFHCG